MQKWRKTIGFLAVFTASAVFCITFFTGFSSTVDARSDDSYKNTLLLTRVIELIRQEYVDESKVSYKDLTYAALKGILSSLDPHSQFLDEESFSEMQRDTKGEFSGLGLVVGMKDNSLIVIAPMEDTPAFRAGILPGDHIIKIDGKSTEKMTLNGAIKHLRGEVGEKIKLTMLRPKGNDPKEPGEVYEAELTRETIKVATVREAKLLPSELTGEERVGYIRLEQFGDNTPEEMEAALTQLEGLGMQALILDLRNNPGGLLDAAVETAGKFLPPGQVIVSTQGRTPAQSFEYRAHGTKRHPNYPIVVLINSYSASGAEIVAGALKDLGRAVLIGETTFGKGSVQSVQDLGGGIGLRLTTAKYYTPSKKTIHEVGVPPDIAAPITDAEERGLVLARSQRLLSADEKDQVRNMHDTQLERAVSALRGIRVYTQRQTAAADIKPKTTATP